MQMNKFILLSLIIMQSTSGILRYPFAQTTKKESGIPEKIAEKRTEQEPAESTESSESACHSCPRRCDEVLKELELEEANEQEYKRHKKILNDENRKEELTCEQYLALEEGARKYKDFDTFEKVMRWRLEVKSTENGEVAIQGTPRMVVGFIAAAALAGGGAAGYALKKYNLI